MRLILSSAVFLLALPMSAKDPPAKASFPASATTAKKEFDAAVVSASKTRDSAVKKATEAFAEDLKLLRLEATKAGKLDEAIALRDLEQAVIKASSPVKTMEFDKPEGGTLTIDARGYRWSDWKQDVWARCEYTQAGGIHCYKAGQTPSFWAQIVISADGKSGLWWEPGVRTVILKAK